LGKGVIVGGASRKGEGGITHYGKESNILKTKDRRRSLRMNKWKDDGLKIDGAQKKNWVNLKGYRGKGSGGKNWKVEVPASSEKKKNNGTGVFWDRSYSSQDGRVS